MTEARMDTTAERIAAHLVAMGYGSGEDIAADDTARAAELAGFDFDPNSDEDMSVLEDAVRATQGHTELE